MVLSRSASVDCDVEVLIVGRECGSVSGEL